MPTIQGAVRMPGRIGWQNAMELLLIGERVDAERAREMGLVWKVVPHDSLMDEARNLADRLCRSAPLAVRATKEVAWRGQQLPWVDAIRFGETMRRVAAATAGRQGGHGRRPGEARSDVAGQLSRPRPEGPRGPQPAMPSATRRSRRSSGWSASTRSSQ